MKLLIAFALAAQPAAPAAEAGCAGAAEERAALETERAALGEAIANVAMGRPAKKRKKTSGGDVARGVAGTAASILLPFPLGLAVNAGAGAAAKAGRKKAPAPAGPDVGQMIEREREIGVRLLELQACKAEPAGQG